MADGMLLRMTQHEHRPSLSPALSGAELLRWYWLRTELVDLARTLDVGRAGGKQELTARLVAALDGGPEPSRPTRPTPPGAAVAQGTPAGRQPGGPLTPETVILPGQRCSQELRRFFVEQLGAGFRFDGPMRRFVAAGAGRTLGEALEHWQATRSAPGGEIGPQFELNRFLRDWQAARPDGRRADALVAWRVHRSLPVDGRP